MRTTHSAATLAGGFHSQTGSARAKVILDNWADYRTRFVKVMPVEYRRALREMEKLRTLQAAELPRRAARAFEVALSTTPAGDGRI